MWRRRLRKWAKWTCTVAAVLAVGFAIWTKFFVLYWYRDLGADGMTLTMAGGLLRVERYPVPEMARWGVTRRSDTEWQWGLKSELRGWGSPLPGLMYRRLGPGTFVAGVSLMYPVLLAASSSAVLWYADRRRVGPGRCAKCGYDRRGLAGDAPCPECGTVPTS